MSTTKRLSQWRNDISVEPPKARGIKTDNGWYWVTSEKNELYTIIVGIADSSGTPNRSSILPNFWLGHQSGPHPTIKTARTSAMSRYWSTQHHFLYFTKAKHLKNYQQCLLFYWKTSFYSWDIQVFVLPCSNAISLSAIAKSHGSFDALKTHSQNWRDFWQLNSFKNERKCFLFHLKSTFYSQDI